MQKKFSVILLIIIIPTIIGFTVYTLINKGNIDKYTYSNTASTDIELVSSTSNKSQIIANYNIELNGETKKMKFEYNLVTEDDLTSLYLTIYVNNKEAATILIVDDTTESISSLKESIATVSIDDLKIIKGDGIEYISVSIISYIQGEESCIYIFDEDGKNITERLYPEGIVEYTTNVYYDTEEDTTVFYDSDSNYQILALREKNKIYVLEYSDDAFIEYKLTIKNSVLIKEEINSYSNISLVDELTLELEEETEEEK